jgi:serine/threonine protein kinase
MVDLYQKIRVDEKVDIWALGCILYYMAFFKHPFDQGTNLQILSGKFKIPPGHGFSDNFIKLIKRLLHLEYVHVWAVLTSIVPRKGLLLTFYRCTP